MPATQPLPVTKGKKTVVRCALLKDGDRQTPPNLTFSITEAADKGDTTLTVSDLTTTLAGKRVYAGQYLLFEDAQDRLYIAQLRADYTGGTSVSVVALPEAIPDNSEAAYPVRFRLRTSADVSISTDVTDVNTFDHSVNGDASPGATSFEFTTDGEYSDFDPGYQTCAYAQRNNQEVWIERQLAAPGPGFIRGKVTSAAALVTTRDEASPNDGNVSANVTVRFVGDVVEANPTPTA